MSEIEDWPPIVAPSVEVPRSVHSPLGPLPVVFVLGLKTRDNEPALGLWVPEERCIKLCAGVHPLTQLVTLYHERIHQILWDAGVGINDEDIEERVCDAISSALVAELLASVTACS